MSQSISRWFRLLKYPSGMIGVILLITVGIMALAAEWVFPDGPWSMAGPPMMWPGQDAAFPLGTDGMGRSIAAGLLHGSRISLAVGFAATVVAAVIGTLTGAVAGYHGGWVDDVLMRFTDAMQTIPSFLAAVVIVGVLSPSITTIIFSIGMVSWPMIARLVRAEFLRLRHQDFVSACRIMGMKDSQIIFRQILPNCLSPIIVASSLMVGTAIVVEAGLSFLGLGDPNVMSWGAIIGNGRSLLRAAWYITAIPSVAVIAVVVALNLLGDALNELLNPRLRQR